MLDRRSHLTPGLLAVKSARQDDVGSGLRRILDVTEERYSWLQRTS
jgi:hypothetical protein